MSEVMLMWAKLFDYAVKNKAIGIFGVLFIVLLAWTMQGYEKREAEYLSHDSEYHQIISDNTRVMQENTTIMKDLQKTNEGFKQIIEVKLAGIEKILDRR
jgi:hypothetical protein